MTTILERVRAAVAAGRPREATELLARERPPLSAELVVVAAEAWAASGAERRAAALLTLATRALPDDRTVAVEAARALLRRGQHRRAARALARHAAGAPLLFALASRQPVPAEVPVVGDDETIDRSLATTTSTADLVALLGRIPASARLRIAVAARHVHEGRRDEARAVLRAGLKGREDARLELALGFIAVDDGAWDEAAMVIARARARARHLSRDPALGVLVALVTVAAGRRNDALSLLHGSGPKTALAALQALLSGPAAPTVPSAVPHSRAASSPPGPSAMTSPGPSTASKMPAVAMPAMPPVVMPAMPPVVMPARPPVTAARSVAPSMPPTGTPPTTTASAVPSEPRPIAPPTMPAVALAASAVTTPTSPSPADSAPARSSGDAKLLPVIEPSVVKQPAVEPSAVTPPVVEPPVVTPPVVEQPVVEPAVVTPPVVEPAVVTPPVIEQAVVTPPVIEQAVAAPPVIEQAIVTPHDAGQPEPAPTTTATTAAADPSPPPPPKAWRRPNERPVEEARGSPFGSVALVAAVLILVGIVVVPKLLRRDDGNVLERGIVDAGVADATPGGPTAFAARLQRCGLTVEPWVDVGVTTSAWGIAAARGMWQGRPANLARLATTIDPAVQSGARMYSARTGGQIEPHAVTAVEGDRVVGFALQATPADRPTVGAVVGGVTFDVATARECPAGGAERVCVVGTARCEALVFRVQGLCPTVTSDAAALPACLFDLAVVTDPAVASGATTTP